MPAIKPLVDMTVKAEIGEMTQYGPKWLEGQIFYVDELTGDFQVRFVEESGDQYRTFEMSEFGRTVRFIPTGVWPSYLPINQPYYTEIGKIEKSDIPTAVLAMYALICDASAVHAQISSNGKDHAKEYYNRLLSDESTLPQLRSEAATVLVQSGMGLEYLTW